MIMDIDKAATMTDTAIILKLDDANQDAIREQVTRLRDDGSRVRVFVPWEHGDAQEYTQAAIRSGCRHVMAIGGDGTLHDVVHGWNAERDAGAHISLVPRGTGNDFSRAVLLEQTTLEDIARLDADSEYEVVDVDFATSPDGDVLINALSIGTPARATQGSSESMKELFGTLAYGLQAVAEWFKQADFEACVRTDEMEWSGRAKFIAVVNGGFVGGGVKIAPAADPRDGVLEVLIVPSTGRDWTSDIDTLAGLQRGIVKNAVVLTGQNVTVETKEEVPASLDGAPFGGDRWEFHVEREALPFRRLRADV